MSEGEITQVKCSKCGRMLGAYAGETFYLVDNAPVTLKDVKKICQGCFGK